MDKPYNIKYIYTKFVQSFIYIVSDDVTADSNAVFDEVSAPDYVREETLVTENDDKKDIVVID